MEQNKPTENFFTKAFRDHKIPSWWAVAGIIFLFISLSISIFCFIIALYTWYKETHTNTKFSIVRIIVAIAIIGVLSSIVLASLNSARMKGQSTQTAETTTDNNPPPLCSNITSLKNQATTVNFKELIKNPDSFNGKIVKFTGQVLQIQESDNYGVIRLAITKNSYGWSSSDIIYVEYQNHTDAVADDIVTVYGQLTGTKTYKSQANYSITIPSMKACKVEKGVEKSITQNQPATAKPSSQKTTSPIQSQSTQQPVTPVQQSAPVITTLAISCFASQSPVDIKQKVTWSSQATGGNGQYSYTWSGSDNLIGNNSSVDTNYLTSGTKTASVKVVSGDQTINQSCTNSVLVASPKTWHTVETFSGQTQKNTSSFSIQGSQWRVNWQETGDGYFGANADSPDDSGDYCSIANIAGSGSDTTYCYKSGTYYIHVNTAQSWSITVEDYY